MRANGRGKERGKVQESEETMAECKGQNQEKLRRSRVRRERKQVYMGRNNQ